MKPIDLRSDTVTQPTPEMREAMYRAEVGDDGWGDDPTVNLLQELAAERLGKEAALFVPSGTMGNLVGILTHCNRGDEAIIGDQSHIFFNEVGGISALGGIHVRTAPNLPDGTMEPRKIEELIRAVTNVHFPLTRLISLENTHNRCSGAVLGTEYTNHIAEIARRNGLFLHLDGARIFNAAVALKVNVKDLVAPSDSVTFCLSKGLACPVGSLLCGSREYIQRARRVRQMVGGGMRQAGVVAAAGLVALDTMIDRLAEDHENAKVLAHELADTPGISIHPEDIHTNIVIFQVERTAPEKLLARLAEEGVKVSHYGGNLIRMVTHYGISRSNVLKAAKTLKTVMETTGVALGGSQDR